MLFSSSWLPSDVRHFNLCLLPYSAPPNAYVWCITVATTQHSVAPLC